MSVSFGGKVLPTKLEMIRLRRSLQVARGVYRILEDKRDVLIRRLNDLIEKAERERDEITEPLTQAYSALFHAYMAMGPMKVETLATTTPESVSVSLKEQTVIGIRIPSVEVEEKQVGLTYGFADTVAAFDETIRKFRQLLPAICRVAETENAIFRLAEELKKTQRLLNALEHLIIPRYQESIRFIASTLEERERDDFVKLKHIKQVLEKRKAAGEA